MVLVYLSLLQQRLTLMMRKDPRENNKVVQNMVLNRPEMEFNSWEVV